MTKRIKLIIEKHVDGYVAYSVGLRGVVVAEGNTHKEVLAEVKSAITFHVETFGPGVLETEEAT